MKHCGTQRLETNRLILRRYEIEDAAAMFKNWASDPEVTKFLMWKTHSNQEESQRIMNDWVKQYPNDNIFRLNIVLPNHS